MTKYALALVSVLLIAQAACLPVTAALETVTSPSIVRTGWNLIALPAIPTNPDPVAVLDEYAPLDTRVYRYEASTQGLIMYDVWQPDKFGNLLLTDGYWLDIPGGLAEQFTFEGITDNNDTDMWVSLPIAGWTLIGHPYSYSVDWANVEVTDGTKTISLADAAKTENPPWLQSIGYWWNSEVQGLKYLGLPDDWPDSDTLTAWHGYWIQSNKDNLALILPASP